MRFLYGKLILVAGLLGVAGVVAVMASTAKKFDKPAIIYR